MKAFLAFIALIACIMQTRGGELVVPASTIGEVFTNITFSSNIVSSVSFTNEQPTVFSVNHTFQVFYAPVGTNTTTLAIDRTIDGANWYIVQTNTLTTSSNFEISAAGKWWKWRYRVYALATNCTMTTPYMSE